MYLNILESKTNWNGECFIIPNRPLRCFWVSEIAKYVRSRSLLYRPDAVENISVREDPDIDIVDEDGVEVSGLLIAEESIGHPDLVRIGQGQILQATWKKRETHKDHDNIFKDMASFGVIHWQLGSKYNNDYRLSMELF